MNDPSRHFLNPFDTKEINFNQMAALATDHIGKLGNQDKVSGRKWAARLAATTAAMAAYDQSIADEMTRDHFLQARKQAKNDFRKALLAAVRGIANWVAAAFGDRLGSEPGAPGAGRRGGQLPALGGRRVEAADRRPGGPGAVG